jgi:hypothetical protein
MLTLSGTVAMISRLRVFALRFGPMLVFLFGALEYFGSAPIALG